MNGSRTVLERTFELARTGAYGGVGEIRARLKAEGFFAVDSMTAGRTLSAQIREICLAARALRSGALAPSEVTAPAGRKIGGV